MLRVINLNFKLPKRISQSKSRFLITTVAEA